ncbi:MAG TPA: hypothetical protein PLC75_05620, partial [Bacillota bacterium]|nr:hypothetical protein [Bacillota bacterium]
MRYRSTRNESEPVSPAEAIVMGIAPGGGLFVPAEPLIPFSPEQQERLREG